jgi:hypothetical protein
MTDSLCTHETLDHELMWRYMRQLLDRVYGVLENETVADDRNYSMVKARVASASASMTAEVPSANIVCGGGGWGNAGSDRDRAMDVVPRTARGRSCNGCHRMLVTVRTFGKRGGDFGRSRSGHADRRRAAARVGRVRPRTRGRPAAFA